MNVLIIGSGAREHAIAWKLTQSPLVDKVFCAPGNAGTLSIGESLPLSGDDFAGLATFAAANDVRLTFVGPEAPLVSGITDYFSARGLPIFGPSRKAAMIEGSKVWAKQLMVKYGVPTARGEVFDSLTVARRYLLDQPLPVVIKADGLAAGKGVIVASERDQALAALDDIMERRVFGKAGDRVIIEECLSGPEVSVLAITDGEAIIPLAPACDYKRAHDGDSGPNTGGMGSYCPTRLVSPELMQRILHAVLIPTVRGLATEDTPYTGILYAGLMLTPDGPKVLEFNCRLGDPETQAVLPLMKTDLAELALATLDGGLQSTSVEWLPGACCGVVLASGGYPGKYRQGYPIEGLDSLEDGTYVFHAGTALDADGRVVTAGGRVLTVVATGPSMAEARTKAYRNAEKVFFEGRHFRHDIALRETI